MNLCLWFGPSLSLATLKHPALGGECNPSADLGIQGSPGLWHHGLPTPPKYFPMWRIRSPPTIWSKTGAECGHHLSPCCSVVGLWAFPLSKTPRCLPFHDRLVTYQAFSVPVTSGFRVKTSLCKHEHLPPGSFCSPRRAWRDLASAKESWPRIGSLACSHGPCSGRVPWDPDGHSTDNASHQETGYLLKPMENE